MLALLRYDDLRLVDLGDHPAGPESDAHLLGSGRCCLVRDAEEGSMVFANDDRNAGDDSCLLCVV